MYVCTYVSFMYVCMMYVCVCKHTYRLARIAFWETHSALAGSFRVRVVTIMSGCSQQKSVFTRLVRTNDDDATTCLLKRTTSGHALNHGRRFTSVVFLFLPSHPLPLILSFPLPLLFARSLRRPFFIICIISS